MRYFRMRTAKNVVDEIEHVMRDFGIGEVFFYDDTFTTNRKRVIEICEEINSRGLDIIWDCRTRVDCVTKEMLYKMKEAGCTRIHYGVEAGDQRILNILRKGFTLEQVRQAFMWTKEAGIRTLAYFMIGSPGEDLRTIEKTFNLIWQLKPDYIVISTTNIHPGTDMYQSALETGYLKSDVWRDYTLGKIGYPPISTFETDEFTKGDLEKLIIRLYKKFYLRPRYIMNQLRKVGSFGEFCRYTRGALTLLSKPPSKKQG